MFYVSFIILFSSYKNFIIGTNKRILKKSIQNRMLLLFLIKTWK